MHGHHGNIASGTAALRLIRDKGVSVELGAEGKILLIGLSCIPLEARPDLVDLARTWRESILEIVQEERRLLALSDAEFAAEKAQARRECWPLSCHYGSLEQIGIALTVHGLRVAVRGDDFQFVDAHRIPDKMVPKVLAFSRFNSALLNEYARGEHERK